MNVYVIETFQLDWKAQKITSQFMILEDKESANLLLEKCMEEYTHKKIEKVIDQDDAVVYKIIQPAVEGMTSESEFFMGWTERNVMTLSDVNMILTKVEKP